MRCKPGDLAIVVNADANKLCFLGRIVRCVELCEAYSTPNWITDPMLTFNGLKVVCNDDCLRPIRPDGEQQDVTRELEVTR